MLLKISEYNIDVKLAKEDIKDKYLKDVPYNTYYVEVNSMELYYELMENLEIASRTSFNKSQTYDIGNYTVYLVEDLTTTSIVTTINKLRDNSNLMLEEIKTKAILTGTKVQTFNSNVDVPVEYNTVAVKKHIGLWQPFIQDKVHISATKGNTNEKGNYTNAKESDLLM